MTGKKSYPAYNGFNHGGSMQRPIQPNQKPILPILILTSFLIPGMGLASDYCMTKVLSAIGVLGNAVKLISKHCERIQCPNCWTWWASKRCFKLAVLLECYAEYTKERPIALWCSVHPDKVKSWSWREYGNFIRKCYSRMYKLGITGGVRVFHAMRVKDDIKDDLRLLGAKDSAGFWKMIRANALNLSSWFLYVYLSPHIHALVFPSWIKPNTAKDITIGKYAVLDTTKDTVAHLRYLLSHCGILLDGENEPAAEFGVLHGWKPEEHLSAAQILRIKNEVANAMELKYDAMKDDAVPDVVDDSADWIPIHEFADYSNEQIQFSDAFICSIQDKNHAAFVEYLIHLYNERRKDTSLDKHKRHVFESDLLSIPAGFTVVLDVKP
jgi:hypothetical protein